MKQGVCLTGKLKIGIVKLMAGIGIIAADQTANVDIANNLTIHGK